MSAQQGGGTRPARTTVHLFGGPYVTVDRSLMQVPEGSKRLLAFLALRRARVERRFAAGALWPLGDDGRAAGNLRSALWRLRGAGIDIREPASCWVESWACPVLRTQDLPVPLRTRRHRRARKCTTSRC